MNNRLALQLVFVVLLAGPVSATANDTQKQRAANQAQLDAACETARQQKLAQVRSTYVEECIAKKQRPDREACERFYADYGERSGQNRAPLFYDLPECVKADDYRRSYRNPDG